MSRIHGGRFEVFVVHLILKNNWKTVNLCIKKLLYEKFIIYLYLFAINNINKVNLKKKFKTRGINTIVKKNARYLKRKYTLILSKLCDKSPKVWMSKK